MNSIATDRKPVRVRHHRSVDRVPLMERPWLWLVGAAVVTSLLLACLFTPLLLTP